MCSKVEPTKLAYPPGMTAKDAEEGGDKQEHEPIFLKKMQASAPGRDIVEWTAKYDPGSHVPGLRQTEPI